MAFLAISSKDSFQDTTRRRESMEVSMVSQVSLGRCPETSSKGSYSRLGKASLSVVRPRSSKDSFSPAGTLRRPIRRLGPGLAAAFQPSSSKDSLNHPVLGPLLAAAE